MQLGELVGSGRSADVFAIDDRWVLRRYRDGSDATAEASVMSYLAERGYPVPRVRDAEDGGNRTAPRSDLVIQRLYGPSILRALDRGMVTAEEAGAVLAQLLHRLHTIPARASADSADRVLHLDLHPDNVMLTPDGPSVIDWRNTEDGPPGLDCAMSALILAQAAVGTTALAAPLRTVLSSLLGHLPPGTFGGEYLAQARARRAADPATGEGERLLLGRAVGLVLELLPG